MNFRNLPRRRHSAELKTAVLAECEVPGASVAAIAQAHGLNANLVHRWRRNQAGAQAPAALGAVGEFMALALPAAALSEQASAAPVRCSPPEIRVELRRGVASATIIWPLAGAVECGAWQREWLK